jgi:bifunctional non-homologous end joining protein LigD
MIVDGKKIELTHSDRVLFPERGITKMRLAEYYAEAAPFMLPHLQNRPINLQRFPRGIAAPGFVQQEAPESRPEWVETITAPKEGGEVEHVVCNNAATLVWLANLSCITIHSWLSLNGDLDVPDRMIFDLDPATDDFETVRSAARLLKELLDEKGLTAFLMTTGSRGLHVTVPLVLRTDFDAVRDRSQEIAAELVKRDPKNLTYEIQKSERKGRLYVDTLRNAYGHTAVAPFAVRARERAPAAAPITWEDLDDPELSARRYTIEGAAMWLSRSADAWQGFRASAVALD